MTQRKLLAVTLTVLMVFSMFSGTVFLASTPAAAGNTSETTPPRFEVTEVGNAGGDLQVTVEATSTDPVKNFTFTYDDLEGTNLGPTELTAGRGGDIQYAYYEANGNGFSPGDTVYEGHPNGDKVTFVFDSGSTQYDYDTDAFRINATAYDASYSSADTGNRSVITGNHYQIQVKDAAGSSISNVPVVIYNASSNGTLGTSFLTTGTLNLDCLGVPVSGTCTNPDTGAASSLASRSQTYPAPISMEAFSLTNANSSGKIRPTSGSTTTLTTDTPTTPTFLQLAPLTFGGTQPVADSATIRNASSGAVVWRTTNLGRESRVPVFLRPNTEYTVTLTNTSSFGTETRSLTLPTKGMASVSLRVAPESVATSTVTGQVVDQSGNPVEGAVVMAQPEFAGGERIDVYNSTTTDANGLFSMRLPESDQLQSEYGFRIIGTDTSGGTPIYYPTTDANDGDGYVVQSGSTVIPAMTIQKGGRVDITVTNSTNTKLPVGFGIASLSQVSTAYPDTERTASSNSFSRFSFGQRPKTAAVSLMSPTTGADTQVTYNIWGLRSTPSKYVCAGQPTITQGSATDSTCTLDQAGYLNISVTQYDSIIQQASGNSKRVKGSGFFYNNELVVRDASTGEVVTYLGPGGIQQSFLSESGSSTYIEIPVPAGDYTVELRPSYDFAPATTVNDTSTVTVSEGSATQVSLDRGDAFEIRPSYQRSQESFNRGADNTIAVKVRDPATGSVLDGTQISANARLLHSNGTTATDPVALSFSSTDSTFQTKTFKPSSLGVDAGRYTLAVRATYTDNSRTYNTTFRRPVQVSGFQTAVQIGSRTVAPGDSILGRIYAYNTTTNPDTAIDASSASQTTITVYDQNGQQVAQTNPGTGFTGGEGSFSLSMPDEPGRYRVSVQVTSDSGSQGIAERWVRVSQVDLEVETDRRTYSPTDPVKVDVSATNATDGSAIQDASLTLRVNGNRVSGSTDSNGEATFTLDPSIYGTAGQWQEGHPITVTMAHNTGNSVVRKTAGTGFEVQAFDARVAPTKDTFSRTESSVLEVRVPTSVSVSSVAVTELDGEQVLIGGAPSNSAVTNPAPGIYRVDLGQRSVGEHVATVTVGTSSAGTQTARTQFDVQQYAISASLNKRSFQTGETIALDVSVRNPDGSVVTNEQVNASLNTTEPVRSVDNASGSTGSNGDVSLSLSSSQSGFHFIKVEVGQQTRYVGLSVSSVTARLEDSNGNPVSQYNAEPGTTQTIYVNASKSDGTDVADGSTVSAFISSYGERIELGSAETTNGDASISFQIPSSVPAREYPLVVDVTTPASGSGLTTGTLNVTGASAKQITTTTNESAYAPGDTARLSATVTTGDGSPVANEPVDFIIESEGTADRRVATVRTNSDGEAIFDYSIPASAGNGQYVVRAALNSTSSIRAYSGYRVRSLDVAVTAEDGPFEPGDTINLTVFANDSTTGDTVNATAGTIELLLPGSNVQTSIDTTGDAPYRTSVTLPDDSSITGTRSIGVTVQQDRATDSDSTLVAVRDSSESANLSISTPVTAGESTTVTVNSTVSTTAVLTAYSPGAGSVAYNDSVAVSQSDTTTQMTIDSPGTHIVRLSVPGVGAITKVVDVKAASGTPMIWSGSSLTTNATEYNATQDIYIKTNQSGMTATVISQNATYTVELDQQSGGTYYGVLSANRPDGVYLVRLDSESATSVNDTIIEVSG